MKTTLLVFISSLLLVPVWGQQTGSTIESGQLACPLSNHEQQSYEVPLSFINGEWILGKSYGDWGNAGYVMDWDPSTENWNKSFTGVPRISEVQPLSPDDQRRREPFYSRDLHISDRFQKILKRTGVLYPTDDNILIDRKKNGNMPDKTHKLDGIEYGHFDPYAGAWVDFQEYSMILNDTGRIIGNYLIRQVDAEGTIDTSSLRYDTFYENGNIKESTQYQRNSQTGNLDPVLRNTYIFPHADTVINEVFNYELVTGTWLPIERVILFKEMIQQGWDGYLWNAELGKYELNKKNRVYYTMEGKIQSSINWNYDKLAGEFVYASKYEYEYDQFGNQVLYKYSTWQTSENSWRDEQVTIRQFNSHNRILEYSNSRWLGDHLRETSKIISEYLNDTLLSRQTNYSLQGVLVPESRYDNEYDGQYRKTLQTRYKWNITEQTWDPNLKYEYEYFIDGQLISMVRSTWNVSGSEWIYSQKTEYEYDPEGRTIIENIYTWAWYWAEYEKYEYRYDQYGNRSQTIQWKLDEYMGLTPYQRQVRVFNEKGVEIVNVYSRYMKEVGAWEYSKEYYEYSEKGYVERMIYLSDEEDDPNDYYYNEMAEILHNEQGMFSEYIGYSQDAPGEEWLMDFKAVCEYGVHGKMTSIVVMYLDEELNKWFDEERIDAVYDQEGRIIIRNYSDWDRYAKKWIIWDRDSLVYDEQGRLKTRIYSNSDNDLEKLQFYRKYEYTYDAKGRPESDDQYTWDPMESVWVKTQYREFGFDENDRLKAMKEYWWNEDEGKFIPSEFDEFAYNALGHLLNTSSSYWNTEEQKWVKSFIAENEYDIRGNLIFRTFSNWDFITREWYPSEREALTYNQHIPCLAVYLPFDVGFNSYEVLDDLVYDFYEYFYDPARLKEIYYFEFYYPDIVYFSKRVDLPIRKESQYWNSESKKWEVGHTTEFLISEAEFTIDAPAAKAGGNFMIYPNPASNFLNFKFTAAEEQTRATIQLSIYDLTGRKVMEVQGHESGSLDISELESGLFIIVVRAEGMEYRRMFVKN